MTDDKDVQAAALVSAVLSAITGRAPGLDQATARQRVAAAAGEILNAPQDIRRRCILLAAAEPHRWQANTVLSLIGRKPAGLTADDIATLLPALPGLLPWAQQSLAKGAADALLIQLEATWADADERGRARLREAILLVVPEVHHVAAALRLRTLAALEAEVHYALIDDTTPVGKALRAVLEAAPEPDAAKTRLITTLAAYPVTGKPRKAWRSDAEASLTALKEPVATMSALLDAALGAPDHERRPHSGYLGFGSAANEALLCAMAVLTSGIAGRSARDGGALLSRLRQLALKAITMPPGNYGQPRSTRLANHCVQAIADAALPASTTELIRIERAIRHGSLLRAVRTAIESLAAAQGLTRGELMELAVEDHGLGADGRDRSVLADGWVAITAAGPRTATVSYAGPDGKPRKSLPAAVKRASADSLAAVSKDLKALRVTIGNERARLDACLAAGRTWTADQWRRRCLEHPVTVQLTRVLIWNFGAPGAAEVTGIPVTGETLLTSDGTELPVPEEAEVRLWHPVHASADEVRAWRQLLLDRRLVQPVKQAFREVYVLTPAEEATRDYSNRFAGHVFEQQRARALMKGRSWEPVPLAGWDDGIYHGVARRVFAGAPALRAEFFFDPADHQDFVGAGLYRYCASDQVRFFDAGSDRGVPLAGVPPRAFSEAMRDVDLFIGVASVGADPEWLDRGEGRRFGDYWHHYAFGNLGVSGEIRREVLAGLVPMLAIADRCELEGRFLKVRGDLRSYRIHLGSGNILMSPNDQYLCIVAARDGRAGKLFLPFDDDPVLSLILSKAFLLADDAAITDESITRQIGGGS